MLFVTGTAACAIALAATALLPASARVLAWGLIDAAYLAGFAAVILTVAPTPAAALIVTDSLTERFGAFIIIVLGETLTGVVGGLASQPVSAARPMPLVLGLALVVLLSIPWGFAVARRLAGEADPPGTPQA
jgi:low temperature requirement protein LtrA